MYGEVRRVHEMIEGGRRGQESSGYVWRGLERVGNDRIGHKRSGKGRRCMERVEEGRKG